MSILYVRMGVLFAIGFLAAMALSGGNSFGGYWGCLWLSILCAQIVGSAGR